MWTAYITVKSEEETHMENLDIHKFNDTTYETSLAGLIYLIENGYLLQDTEVLALTEDKEYGEIIFDTLLIEFQDDTYRICVLGEDESDDAILMMSDVSFSTFFHIHKDYVIDLEEEAFDMQSELYTLDECVTLDNIMLQMKDILSN